MKKILLLSALFISALGFAQTDNINNYKYVIVPEKFDFLKEPNKYNLNSLTKMVFEKYGFVTFFANDKMPDELALNKCKALYGDLVNESGMLNTKLQIVLKDCSGKVLYTSEEGRSKEKEYQKAYYEALRRASASLESLNYKYVAPAATAQTAQPVASATVPAPAQSATPAATPQAVVTEGQLFAQPIANGFQLVDTTPKVVAKMYKTSQPDYYTAQGENKNGVIFKKGNDWFFEYYVNDKLISEKLNIKF
ncbi:hypothetical protein GR160_07470 [Flavobacterium sp. Sd200]|uniref:hypothetical protein n=1 Tax=Flavobacterium sp. Sd200 TaxID=2692211 RepID=UPI00136D0A7D|nr:hypothetical protein [Flavobacterium sp. Sd200]MXN91066.1 hypothetical protein [Flavobacterium sp. Sd200]